MTTRIVFDIETEPFSKAFAEAPDRNERLALAPRMKVACTFDGTDWRFYTPAQAKELIAALQAADEVVSYNGLAFDELVLRRHHGLSGPLPLTGTHVDLCHALAAKGTRTSLDALALTNFGERKHTHGRAIAGLDYEGMKEACRSDVWQTYRLWELWREGKLKLPPPRVYADDYDDVGPGHHQPEICRNCHDVYSLELMDEDPDDMSEGQAADYEAGLWGTSYCTTCGHVLDWEV